MRGFVGAVWAESVKMMRSVVYPVTFVVASIMPLMMGFMMFVMKNPDIASRLGLIGTKAKLAGAADWPSYYSLMSQAICGFEIVLFGFVFSWVFGREYSDRTIKDLLALPVPRMVVASAKIFISAVWCFGLFLYILVLLFLAGFAIGLPQWSGNGALNTFFVLLLVSFMLIYISSTVGFVANYTRGYLAPVGFVILAAVFINFATALGFGDYYPWAIPMLYATKAGAVPIGTSGWLIVFFTGAAGIGGTLLWWRYADQK
jgi:ABC-type transport system involved in multi-copper enzyme maturation permease subunit